MEYLSIARLLDVFRKRAVFLQEDLETLYAPVDTPVTGLLRLPFEIRLRIYFYCIPRKRIIDVGKPCFQIESPAQELDHTQGLEGTLNVSDDAIKADDGNSERNKNTIFLLSKQVGREALDVLYGENIFKLHLHGVDEYFLKRNFAEANRQRMRNLILIARPKGISYSPEHKPDDALWRSILPQLKRLRIVAQQPLQAGDYRNAPTLQQDIDCWIKWIRPLLQCFGKHLSSQTIVEMDYDGRIETGAVVEECLPHGYREIRCRFGDLIFRRAQVSWDEAYCGQYSRRRIDKDPMNSRDIDGDWDSY